MTSTNCMKALCLAGRIILENGGETYRAEDTVLRMARALGLNEPDVFAIPSGLFISFVDESGEQRTSISRVYLRGTQLSRINRVNELSRALSAGKLEPEKLLAELQAAERLGDGKPAWYAPLMAFLTSAAFAVMFGGGLLEILLGGLCGGLTQVLPRVIPSRERSAGMSGTLLSSVFCAFIPLTFRALTGLCATEVVIASSIMPLVPGLSMTNATQDILRGDMVSGVAHCARAVMIAAMVAGGAIVGTHLASTIGLMSQASMPVSTLPFWVQAVLAFISSYFAGAGFGLLLSAPKKAVNWGGILGAVGYTLYWLCMQSGMAETAAMFLGALAAAIGTQIAARRFKMIATVFVTIAILPMVPGLGLYRAMSALAQGQLASGGAIAAHTMALIVMIALGIAMGSTLAVIPRRKGKS
jgi:uncharacterized membrane protein YjjP (DUF1212 family)